MQQNNITHEQMGNEETKEKLIQTNIDDNDNNHSEAVKLAFELFGTADNNVKQNSKSLNIINKEPVICSIDHTQQHQLKQIDDINTDFDSGYLFHDNHCAIVTCNKKIVKTEKCGNSDFKPSGSTPLFCCPNIEGKCTYALCWDCYSSTFVMPI